MADEVLSIVVRNFYDVQTYTCFAAIFDEPKTETHISAMTHIPVKNVRICMANLCRSKFVCMFNPSSRHQTCYRVNKRTAMKEINKRWKAMRASIATAATVDKTQDEEVTWRCSNCEQSFTLNDIIDQISRGEENIKCLQCDHGVMQEEKKQDIDHNSILAQIDGFNTKIEAALLELAIESEL